MARKCIDATGREWNVALHLAGLDALEDEGISLDAMLPKVGAKNDEEFLPWHEFLADVVRQFDMFFALVKEQAGQMTKREVRAGFTTDEATDAMSEAVIGSIVDFFHHRSPPRAAMLRKSQEISAKLMKKTAARIDAMMPDIDKIAESVPGPSDAEITSGVIERLKKSPGNAQATSGSTL